MQKKISDILPKTEILAQLAEEASELAQDCGEAAPCAGWNEPDTEEHCGVRSKSDGRICGHK